MAGNRTVLLMRAGPFIQQIRLGRFNPGLVDRELVVDFSAGAQARVTRKLTGLIAAPKAVGAKGDALRSRQDVGAVLTTDGKGRAHLVGKAVALAVIRRDAGEVQLADGSMATVGVFDVDGQEVSVVDFDQDGNPDVAICDANGNGSIDVGEAVDLHTGQVITPSGSDFADAGVDDSADPNLQTASLENPDVAPDMPDYMSDADIQMA